ncbi:hypothetical protein BDV95DRAFT_636857 [Massariosphaeria phaeospora]|uniref:Uncharacterized protein n=1 Tax=Massariosphaeria phaeospora TaxID=100035 RepID=A0A7C8I5Z7_9PLEO|nr:hypothetical protein BDV95DRAFT_636857 [Massariosphaeria phaeospora]
MGIRIPSVLSRVFAPQEEVPQKPFRFLDLSGELRNRVYYYVATMRLDPVPTRFQALLRGDKSQSARYAALTLVNRQIRHEYRLIQRRNVALKINWAHLDRFLTTFYSTDAEQHSPPQRLYIMIDINLCEPLWWRKLRTRPPHRILSVDVLPLLKMRMYARDAGANMPCHIEARIQRYHRWCGGTLTPTFASEPAFTELWRCSDNAQFDALLRRDAFLKIEISRSSGADPAAAPRMDIHMKTGGSSARPRQPHSFAQLGLPGLDAELFGLICKFQRKGGLPLCLWSDEEHQNRDVAFSIANFLLDRL